VTEPDPQATAAAVIGLAREVETLRRNMELLSLLPERLEEVAGMVLRLAQSAAGRRDGEQDAATVSWLAMPADATPNDAIPADAIPTDAESLLLELIGWLSAVYLRYADGARGLPGCWLWHPDVVEELLWLHQAWAAAYALGASVSQAADWHDRQRPGVVRRIRDAAGLCSIENHQPGHDRHAATPQVPLADAAPMIATWWATHRSRPAPGPTAEQLATATHRPRSRS
jgi:hypothetical protein